MVKKYEMTLMKRDGSTKPVRLYTSDRQLFYTKPNSDGRTSEWWGFMKPTGGMRYTLLAAIPAPKWLKDLFGGKK